MKNKIFTILIVLIANTFILSKVCFAQISNVADISQRATALKPNTRFTDNFLNQFVGTWVYESANISIKIILNKTVSNLGSASKPLEVEMLNGGYLYIKNGHEVANTLKSKPLFGSSNGTNEVTFSILNEKTGKSTLIKIISVDEHTIKLALNSRRGEGIRQDNNLELPLNLNLSKKL